MLERSLQQEGKGCTVGRARQRLLLLIQRSVMETCTEGEQLRWVEIAGHERDKDAQSMRCGNRLDLRNEGEKSQGWLPGPWDPRVSFSVIQNQRRDRMGG